MMHTIYIDLYKFLSSVLCVNIVLYQKNAGMNNLNTCEKND